MTLQHLDAQASERADRIGGRILAGVRCGLLSSFNPFHLKPPSPSTFVGF